MKRRFILILILLSIAVLGDAQVKIFTPTDSNIRSSSDRTSYNREGYGWRVKLDLFESLLTGTGMVLVEKPLNDFFGIEVGAGITYFSIIQSYKENSTNGSGSLKPDIASIEPAIAQNFNYTMSEFKNYKSKIGFAASVSPRIYIDNDPDDGYFIGMLLQYKNFNYETIGASGKYIPQQQNLLNLGFMSGGVYEINDQLLLDGYTAIGITMADDKRNIIYDISGGSIKADGKAIMAKERLFLGIGLRLIYTFN